MSYTFIFLPKIEGSFNIEIG